MPTALSRSAITWSLIGCAGFFLLPWTTLAWAICYAPVAGVHGFGWFVVASEVAAILLMQRIKIRHVLIMLGTINIRMAEMKADGLRVRSSAKRSASARRCPTMGPSHRLKNCSIQNGAVWASSRSVR